MKARAGCRRSPIGVLDHKALLDGDLDIAMAVRRLPLARLLYLQRSARSSSHHGT